MEGILPELGTRDKKRIREQSRRCRNAALKTRYLIIVNLMDGQTTAQTAAALQVGRSTVYAVAKRFRQYGEAGLVDRREENGNRKLDLELHPEKTRIVYCKDDDRRGSHKQTSFDFLGYTFRSRRAKNRHGKLFISFLPGVSAKAAKSIRDRTGRRRLLQSEGLAGDDLHRSNSCS